MILLQITQPSTAPGTFWQYLLGTDNYSLYAAQWVAALIGIFIGLLVHALSRDPTSRTTPYRWSWNFLLSDNVKRALLSILLVFITLRFPTYLFKWILSIDLTLDKNSEGAMVVAAVAGFLNDLIAKKLKDANFLGLAQTKARENFVKEQQ